MPSISQKTEYDQTKRQNVVVGVEATATVSFESTNIDKAGEIYDELALLDGMT